MYNLKVIPTIVGEAELLSMDRSVMEIIKSLLDDTLSYDIIKYFGAVDNCVDLQNDFSKGKEYAKLLIAKTQELKDVLYLDAKRLSMRYELDITKGDLNLIPSTTLDSYLYLSDAEQEALKAQLDLLLSMEDNYSIVSTIEPRSINNFYLLMEKLGEWDNARYFILSKFSSASTEAVNGIRVAVMDNKERFYTRSEKSRTTGLGQYLYNLSTYRVVRYGLDFRKKYTMNKREVVHS